MNLTRRLVIATLTILSLLPAVASAGDLKLVPEPRQVKLGDGGFTVTGKTRIIINAAHADQDRTAAEMALRRRFLGHRADGLGCFSSAEELPGAIP